MKLQKGDDFLGLLGSYKANRSSYRYLPGQRRALVREFAPAQVAHASRFLNMNPIELIRHCFAAYETKDREAIETLIAPNFTFSSPLDDNISRETYFERCWPNSEHLKAFSLERIFAQGNEAFVTYLAEETGGKKFRNTEFFRCEGDQITHVDVYFGREGL